MGTIKKGILGGFSGKVGTVVGGAWKGINYMRSLPSKIRNPRTLSQRSHRTKFALTLKFLQPLNDFLRSGWKLYAHRQSPFNAAMSYAFANAVTGDYPDYQIDPAKVLVSRGSLAPAINPRVTIQDGAAQFSWDDNSGDGSAKPTDKALIAVLNPAQAQAVAITAGASRSEGLQNLKIPANWTEDELHPYIAFISEDGKEIANSVYLGSLVMEDVA